MSTLAKYIVAGLDERFNWSPPVALWLSLFAILVAAFGYGLVTWSMVTNAYFATISRIQSERGQYVVTDGPYHFVRHPGYIGSILFDLATPLALGSLWALVPGVISALLMIIRTQLEDQMLQQELKGSQETGRSSYIAKVCFCLLDLPLTAMALLSRIYHSNHRPSPSTHLVEFNI